jgi:hypothetical protein
MKADIQARSQREPILVKDGFVVDGRHRLRACEELGIEPKLQEYEGTDIIGEIASRNLFRRNLTDKQRAELVAKMIGDKLSAEAEARRQSNLRKGNQSPDVLNSTHRGRTHERVASVARVSQYAARRAIAAIKQKSPTEKKKKQRPRREIPFEHQVLRRFERFMDFYSVTQHRDVKKIIHKFTAP